LTKTKNLKNPLDFKLYLYFQLTFGLQGVAGGQEVVKGLAVGIAVAPLASTANVIPGFVNIGRTPGLAAGVGSVGARVVDDVLVGERENAGCQLVGSLIVCS
jgi:hypothetical protein